MFSGEIKHDYIAVLRSSPHLVRGVSDNSHSPERHNLASSASGHELRLTSELRPWQNRKLPSPSGHWKELRRAKRASNKRSPAQAGSRTEEGFGRQWTGTIGWCLCSMFTRKQSQNGRCTVDSGQCVLQTMLQLQPPGRVTEMPPAFQSAHWRTISGRFNGVTRRPACGNRYSVTAR